MKVHTSVILLTALALVAMATFGQSVTTGALSGEVTATEGGTALPGAAVTAVHEPTGTRYSSVTRADGRFSLLNVRVGGPYTMTVDMEGFRSESKGDVFVQLGETRVLKFGLELETITEQLLVVAESNPIINPTRTGAAANVAQEAIDNLPTIGRGLEDFARVNPFFTVAAENDDPNAISVAGRSGRYNNIQIDGAVNNDLFGLADQGTPGGQADSTPISLDAIQELQLVVADFDVRQGGFSGGSVNAVTRSGTNAFKGSVFYFTRDDSLIGDGPPELGEFGTFEEDQLGFRLGGPLAKDKIFFFVNAEFDDKSTPTGWSIDGSAGQAFANGALVNEGNRFRQFLIDTYGFDPGGLAQNNRDTPSDKYFGRLDFNLADNHQLTLRHNFIDAQNDVNRPGSFTYEFPSETYAFSNETNSTVAQLNTVIGARSFNEARVTLQTIKDRRAGRGGLTFPWIEVENVNGFEFEAGTEPFSTRNALDQDIFEITDDFVLIKGNHTLTFGTHNELFSFDNLFIQNAFGSYEFRTLADLERGVARRYNVTVVNPGQAPSQQFDVTQIGFYAGDTWAARGNLTLTYGLRVDIPFFPDTPSRNPTTEQLFGARTDVIPDGEQLWQPRFGFNYDPKGLGKQQVRGGAGIFAGRTPYVWISNNYARTGVEQRNITAFNVPFNPDPFNPPTNFTGGSVGEFNLIDPNFEFPQLLRVNLAYDRELPWWNLIGSVEAVWSDSLQEINYQNLNVEPTGQVLAAEGRPLFREINPSIDGAYFITNTSKGEATNIAVKIEKPFSGGLWGHVSYAYGSSKVVNEGTSSRAVSNWVFNEALDPNNPDESVSDFEVRHRFNASLSYRFNRSSKWPTTLSAYYNHQAGRPFSYLVDAFPFASVNGDDTDGNDLFWVPNGPNDVILRSGSLTQAQAWDLLNAFISADPVLNSRRGQFVPRNAARAPWSTTLDLRLAQDLPLKKTNLQLTVDILNLTNLLDEDSGLLRFVEFNTVSLMEFQGIDAASGKPIYNLRNVVSDPQNNSIFELHPVGSRWQMKLGLRWSF